MKKLSRMLLVGACAVALMTALGCSGNDAPDVPGGSDAPDAPNPVSLTVYGANSLTKAMPELQEAYTSTHPWVSFTDSQFKGSGDLVAMLTAEPAGADVLITASKGSMDKAETAGLIDASTRVTMYANDLVIVAATDSAITAVTLEDVAKGEYKVGVGDDSVPAGNYAMQALSTVGCFNDPEGKVGPDSAGKADGTDAFAGTPLAGKVVTATSVGNVCKTVTSGEADIAFVYTSDVYRFDGVKIVGVVPADSHKNIVYPGAVCAQSANADEAAAFITWCYTDAEAIKILQKWGFEVA